MPTLARNNSYTFQARFVDVDGSTALIPYDSAYPAVEVVGPDGQAYASGVALDKGNGLWEYRWLVDGDAPIGDGWAVEWSMVSSVGQSMSHTETFSVVEDRVDVTDDQDDTTKIIPVGDKERLRFICPDDPYDLSVRLTYGNQYMTAQKSDLTHVIVDGEHHYYCDTPSLQSTGEYRVDWRIELTQGSPIDRITRWVIVPPSIFHTKLPDLEQLVNKLGDQQRASRQDWNEGELYRSFQLGVDWINGVHPVTSWSMQALLQSPLYIHTLTAAAFFALKSRQILEVDISFTLTGQRVTLEHDASGQLETITSQLYSMLTDQAAVAKRHFARKPRSSLASRVNPVRGLYSNRPIRLGSLPIDQGLGAALASLGLPTLEG